MCLERSARKRLRLEQLVPGGAETSPITGAADVSTCAEVTGSVSRKMPPGPDPLDFAHCEVAEGSGTSSCGPVFEIAAGLV